MVRTRPFHLKHELVQLSLTIYTFYTERWIKRIDGIDNLDKSWGRTDDSDNHDLWAQLIGEPRTTRQSCRSPSPHRLRQPPEMRVKKLEMGRWQWFWKFWALDKSKIKHVMGINTWGKCYPVVRVAHPREGPARQLTIQWRLWRNFGLYATELHWVMKYMFLIRCWGPWFTSCSTVSSLITW